MFPNRDSLRGLVCGLAAVAVLAAAPAALAKCDKCPDDAKALGEALMSSKVTLATATSLAEATTKGIGVKAVAHKHEDVSFIQVYCIAAEKILAVQVDCATGKPSEPAEVKDLDSQPDAAEAAEGDAAAAPSDAEVESRLDAIAAATKAGKLDEAEGSLSKLEQLKNVSDPLKEKIDAARKALDAAKAASDIKKKLPGQP